MPAGHALAARAAVHFTEVLAEPFVCLYAGSAIHTFMMNARRAAGQSPRCAHPGAQLRRHLPHGRRRCRHRHGAALRTVEINDPWAPRDLQLCVRSRAALTPAATALLMHLAGKSATGQAPATMALDRSDRGPMPLPWASTPSPSRSAGWSTPPTAGTAKSAGPGRGVACPGDIHDGLVGYTMNHLVLAAALFQRPGYVETAAHKAEHDTITAAAINLLSG